MTARTGLFTWRRIAGVVAVTATLAILFSARPQAAATIAILNNDGAGEGFNDPTPVAPIGGNPGTTLGQQRLIAFQHAANIWGATLTSTVTIVVRANFDPLTCTPTGAVLGSAGPITVSRDFTGVPIAATWYHAALANRLAGTDLVTTLPDIGATFNVNLGQPGCLTGSPFYLGLDNNVPAGQVNLIVVLLHEFGHGLGFSTVTNGSTGAQISGFPSVYDRFALDNTSGLTWNNMTNAQRVASAINTRKLVWNGANVTAAAPGVLSLGTPELTASAPSSVAGSYLVGLAAFGPALTSTGVTGEVMPVSSPAGGAACNPLTGVDAVAVNNKVALIDRGVCGFAVKVKNAQNAGARAVIMVNNAPGSPPPGMGGTDPTITIPSVMITQADGTTFKNALRFRSRTSSGVFTTMRVNGTVLLGADPAGRVLLYTPNPFIGGSSVSHWDTSAFRNLLMEPNINSDLTQSLNPPFDLTRAFMTDIGW
jgi:hypothetical protein